MVTIRYTLKRAEGPVEQGAEAVSVGGREAEEAPVPAGEAARAEAWEAPGIHPRILQAPAQVPEAVAAPHRGLLQGFLRERRLAHRLELPPGLLLACPRRRCIENLLPVLAGD